MSQVNSYDREQYATDGVTKTFSFGWDVNSTDDVKVNFVRDDGTILNVGTFIDSNDDEYTTSNFSFVVELNRQGGTITFADTPADDQNIIIWRETELVYENSFKTATAFPAAAIDKAYRKIWLALQEVQSDVIHNTVRMTPNQRGLHFGEFSEDVTDRLVYYSDPNKELLFTPFTVAEVQNTIAIAQNIPSIAGDAAEALSRATAALTIANQAKSEAQIARQDAATAIQTANNIDSKAQSALDKANIAQQDASDAKNIANTTANNLSGHIADKANPHEVTKAQVGLGNVDNTSDLNKPISTATQTALNAKQDTLVNQTNIKSVNGNSLLGSGNITIDSLPSQTGQSGKFLTTDGTAASWATVDALPSQTGMSGKFLTTNGTTASWGDVSQMTATYDSTTKTITFA